MRVVAIHAEAVCVVTDLVHAAGLEVAVIDNGADLEAFVRSGRAAGVIDLWLGDMADDRVAPDRLTAASALGVPQVVASGGLPASFSLEAADRLGLDVAQKVSASSGPAAVLLPLRGLTPAGEVFNQCVRNWAYGFELVEAELAADDPAFATAACDILFRLMGHS